MDLLHEIITIAPKITSKEMEDECIQKDLLEFLKMISYEFTKSVLSEEQQDAIRFQQSHLTTAELGGGGGGGPTNTDPSDLCAPLLHATASEFCKPSQKKFFFLNLKKYVIIILLLLLLFIFFFFKKKMKKVYQKRIINKHRKNHSLALSKMAAVSQVSKQSIPIKTREETKEKKEEKEEEKSARKIPTCNLNCYYHQHLQLITVTITMTMTAII
ncbi:hypothetical protein RFI_16837, partial [Reticulomyxa filosa]